MLDQIEPKTLQKETSLLSNCWFWFTLGLLILSALAFYSSILFGLYGLMLFIWHLYEAWGTKHLSSMWSST